MSRARVAEVAQYSAFILDNSVSWKIDSSLDLYCYIHWKNEIEWVTFYYIMSELYESCRGVLLIFAVGYLQLKYSHLLYIMMT